MSSMLADSNLAVVLCMTVLFLCCANSSKADYAEGDYLATGWGSGHQNAAFEQAVLAEHAWEQTENGLASFLEQMGNLFAKLPRNRPQNSDSFALSPVERRKLSHAKRNAVQQSSSLSGHLCSEPFGLPVASDNVCSPDFTCNPKKLRCSGLIVDVEAYNGSLAQCTLEQVACHGAPAPALLPNRGCLFHKVSSAVKNNSLFIDRFWITFPPGGGCFVFHFQIICNGTEINTLDVRPRNLANCNILQVPILFLLLLFLLLTMRIFDSVVYALFND